MAHLVLPVLGHHVTQQVATNVAKRVGKYALEQGVKYAKKKITSPFRDTTKRLAESFQEIDTVPLKRRNLGCREEEDCFHDGYFDSSQFSQSTSPGGGVLPHLWSDTFCVKTPFTPVQGDDIDNRRGRSVCIEKINIRGTFELQDQPTDTGTDEHTNPAVRFIVFVDKQCNGAAPTGDQLMKTGSNQDTDSYRNLLYNNRFVVLEDKTFVMNSSFYYDGSASLTYSGQYTKYLHVEIPCNIEVRFNAGNAGTAADCLENLLCYAIVAGSNITNRTGFDVRCLLQSRITFQSLSRY